MATFRLTAVLMCNHVLKYRLNNLIQFYSPSVTQVRYRKVHLRKPITHLQREIVKAVTQPRYTNRFEGLPIEEICSKAITAKRVATEGKFIHPLDRIIGDEVREKLLNAPFIVIFHANPWTKENYFNFKVDLHKINISFVYHNQKIIKLALQGTHYEPLLRLYEARSITFIADEAHFAKILKIEKKYPFATLIAAVYEGRIISVTDFKSLALDSRIESYHSQLSALLTTSGQNLSSNLTGHQQGLCNSLQRYILHQSEKKESEKE